MLVIAKCAMRVFGNGKKDGKPYDFYQLETMVKAENVSTANYNRIAYGLQDMEPLNLDASLLPQFQKLADKFPCVLDVTLELRPHFGKYENTVVAVSLPKAA